MEYLTILLVVGVEIRRFIGPSSSFVTLTKKKTVCRRGIAVCQNSSSLNLSPTLEFFLKNNTWSIFEGIKKFKWAKMRRPNPFGFGIWIVANFLRLMFKLRQFWSEQTHRTSELSLDPVNKIIEFKWQAKQASKHCKLVASLWRIIHSNKTFLQLFKYA